VTAEAPCVGPCCPSVRRASLKRKFRSIRSKSTKSMLQLWHSGEVSTSELLLRTPTDSNEPESSCFPARSGCFENIRRSDLSQRARELIIISVVPLRIADLRQRLNKLIVPLSGLCLKPEEIQRVQAGYVICYEINKH
jgi:hypothetical protein